MLTWGLSSKRVFYGRYPWTVQTQTQLIVALLPAEMERGLIRDMMAEIDGGLSVSKTYRSQLPADVMAETGQRGNRFYLHRMLSAEERHRSFSVCMKRVRDRQRSSPTIPLPLK